MRPPSRLLAWSIGMLLSAAPIIAHHAFTAEFDASKPVTIRGFVTKVEWTNPHVWVYLDVKDQAGAWKRPGRRGADRRPVGRRSQRRPAPSAGELNCLAGRPLS